MVMQWRTREWHGSEGDLTDDEVAALNADYESHLQRVMPRLPNDLLVLAGLSKVGPPISLHDGRVEWWSDDVPEAFTLQVFCGDNPIGYRRVIVQYQGDVEVTGGHDRTVARWLDDPRTELLYQEVDLLPDGRFEHRHLLWPEGELGIRFRNLDVVSAPVPFETYSTILRRKRLEASKAVARLLRVVNFTSDRAQRVRVWCLDFADRRRQDRHPR